MLSSAALAALRAAGAQFLVERCTLERETKTVDQYGGITSQWESVAVDVPCRLIKGGMPITQMAGGQETIPEVYKIALAAGQTVGVDYRLSIGANVFNVISVETALSNAVWTVVRGQRRTLSP